MKDDCTEERFLNDVKDHKTQIMRNEDLHRHIRFRKPETSSYGFDLITWPGYLCYCGDMGTYVFSRIPDMFQFFRNKSSDQLKLEINTMYWAEKCEAVDRHSPIEKYNPDKFRERITEFMDESNISEEIRQSIKDKVLVYADEEHSAIAAAVNFECKGFQFNDFMEVDLYTYTFRFIWCLYALVWGIRKYDEAAKNYISNEDLFNDFLTECCIIDPDAKEKASKLYDRFVEWYHSNIRRREPSGTWLGKLLSKRFIKGKIEGYVVYQGIALK